MGKGNFSKQFKTTLNKHWEDRLVSLIKKTGLKESEILRDGVKLEIEIQESRLSKVQK